MGFVLTALHLSDITIMVGLFGHAEQRSPMHSKLKLGS